MSIDSRLSSGLASVIISRLERGSEFVVLPEVSSPLPLADLVSALLAWGDVRIGIFAGGYTPSDSRVTTEVQDVIDWRNDPTVAHPIVVLGNLDRHRASGLADIRQIEHSEVRRRLLLSAHDELQAVGVPANALKLLTQLSKTESLTDLRGVAAYCELLLTTDEQPALAAKAHLWLLGLLPDSFPGEIDRRRLNLNDEVVRKLRSMDATTRQRLIGHLSQAGEEGTDYAAIRRFASSGKVKHLAALDFELVQQALKSTSGKKPGKKKQTSSGTVGELVAAIRDKSFDEADFVDQVRRDPGDEVGGTHVTVGSTKIDWEETPLDVVGSLLDDAGDEVGYDSRAGSIEVIPEQEPFPQPGKGEVEWRSLADIGEQLRRLEKRAEGLQSKPSEIIDTLIQRRAKLLPHLTSIPSEGTRLFLIGEKLAGEASAVVDTWISLWNALRSLRDHLAPEDQVYVRRLAERLASTDLRLVKHGAELEAYVLPLHPIVLEPRLRAADLFRQADDVDDDFFDLVVGSLDPSVPSMSIPVEEGPRSLGYAGQWKGLLHYARRPRQVDSADVNRTMREIVQRFVNVHPYASLSLSVALVEPPARAAKALLRWLGESEISQVSLYAYADRRSAEEIRNALDEAGEELASGEISPTTFEFEVVPITSLAEVPSILQDGHNLPHLLFTFDVGEVENSSSGFEFSAQPLGSLVSEWIFDTDPLEDARPVIRPRTGSDRLTTYLVSQAGVFDSSLPAQQRSPLLAESTEATIGKLGELATWVVLCEGVSALVPPLDIEDLQLVGRMGAGNHVAFVYSSQVALLLEPVVKYLWNSTWLDPDEGAVMQFLLGTIRMALPEGLLGFFKARGALSRESVLGRLGFAAALAHLEEELTGHHLIVSLDTEGARRWLGLREGKERRADLLVFRTTDSGSWEVEAVEVKARSETLSWTGSPPEAVATALEQVREMHTLLLKIFGKEVGDAFTPSRREILKRQVFLEAFQQWEPLRLTDEDSYADRIAELNNLFDGAIDSVRRRVLLVNPTHEGEVEEREVDDAGDQVPVHTLGVPSLKRSIDSKPGAAIEIPIELLDELGFSDAHQVAEDVPRLDEGPIGHRGDSDVSAEDDLVAPPPLSDDQDKPAETTDSDRSSTPDSDETHLVLAAQLRDAFVARKAPFRTVETGQIVSGPTVVQIPFTVPVGAKLSQLAGQEGDIARDLGVQSVRISNWEGRPGYAVAELPRAARDIPDVSTLRREAAASAYLTLALGAQIDYAPFWTPLDELPHLLAAGTTGSGKSVFLRSILWQLTHLYEPSELDLVVIDAKGMADYLDFAGAPHIKDSTDFHAGASGALELLEDVIDRRLPERTAAFRTYAGDALQRQTPVQLSNIRQLLADARNRGVVAPVRPLVIVVDEFAELVLSASDRRRFENAVSRFVGIARAIGGHLIAATQRPSTDVVTGVMKANFARVALRVQQSVDSRVILDENGAEALLGRGDMLFKSPNAGLVRLQGYSAIGPYSFRK